MARRRIPPRDEVVKIVCDNIRRGETIKFSCELAGIAYVTLFTWMQTDKKVMNAVKTAESDARREMIDAIRKAGNSGTWQAASWWLERIYPDEFGRRITIKLSELKAEAAAVLAGDADLDPYELLDEAEAVLRDAAT